eukprot:gene32688-17706_t
MQVFQNRFSIKPTSQFYLARSRCNVPTVRHLTSHIRRMPFQTGAARGADKPEEGDKPNKKKEDGLTSPFAGAISHMPSPFPSNGDGSNDSGEGKILPLMSIDAADYPPEFSNRRLLVFSGMVLGYMGLYFTRGSLTYTAPVMVGDPSLAIDLTAIGAMTSAFPLAYVIAKFSGGVLGAKFSATKMLGWGLFITAIINLLFGFCGHSTAMLTALWFINGGIQGVGAPASAILLTSWFATKERGTYWGLWNAGANMGGFFTPLLVGYVAKAHGWQWGMWVPGICGLILAFYTLAVVRDSPEEAGFEPTEDSPSGQAYKESGGKPKAKEKGGEAIMKALSTAVQSRGIQLLALTYFFVYIVRQGATSWLVFYLMQAKGVADSAQAAATVSGLELGGFVGGTLAGYLSDVSIRRAKSDNVGHVGRRVQIVMWLCIAALGFSIYGPHMLIGLCGAELVDKQAVGASQGVLGLVAYTGAANAVDRTAVGASQGVLGLVAYIGAANAGFPLSYLVKLYELDGCFITLACATAVASPSLMWSSTMGGMDTLSHWPVPLQLHASPSPMWSSTMGGMDTLSHWPVPLQLHASPSPVWSSTMGGIDTLSHWPVPLQLHASPSLMWSSSMGGMDTLSHWPVPLQLHASPLSYVVKPMRGMDTLSTGCAAAADMASLSYVVQAYGWEGYSITLACAAAVACRPSIMRQAIWVGMDTDHTGGAPCAAAAACIPLSYVVKHYGWDGYSITLACAAAVACIPLSYVVKHYGWDGYSITLACAAAVACIPLPYVVKHYGWDGYSITLACAAAVACIPLSYVVKHYGGMDTLSQLACAAAADCIPLSYVVKHFGRDGYSITLACAAAVACIPLSYVVKHYGWDGYSITLACAAAVACIPLSYVVKHYGWDGYSITLACAAAAACIPLSYVVKHYGWDGYSITLACAAAAACIPLSYVVKHFGRDGYSITLACAAAVACIPLSYVVKHYGWDGYSITLACAAAVACIPLSYVVKHYGWDGYSITLACAAAAACIPLSYGSKHYGWDGYSITLACAAAAACIPLSYVVKHYGWDGYFITLACAAAVAIALLVPLANARSHVQLRDDEAKLA